MGAYEEARRYLWLYGTPAMKTLTNDDPNMLLLELVKEHERIRGAVMGVTERSKFEFELTRARADLEESKNQLRKMKAEHVKTLDEFSALTKSSKRDLEKKDREIDQLTKDLDEAKRKFTNLQRTHVETIQHRAIAESQMRVIATSGANPMSKLAGQPTDALDDPKFVPCRDERCPIDDLHQQHVVTHAGRGPRKRRNGKHA